MQCIVTPVAVFDASLCALVELLGFGIAALIATQCGQRYLCPGVTRRVDAEKGRCIRHGALEMSTRLLHVAAAEQAFCEGETQIGGQLRAIGKACLHHRIGALHGLAEREFAAGVVRVGKIEHIHEESIGALRVGSGTARTGGLMQCDAG